MAQQQIKASFNGTQDYVDVTWSSPLAAFRLLHAIVGAPAPLPEVFFQSVNGFGARVSVTARGTFDVWVTCVEIPS